MTASTPSSPATASSDLHVVLGAGQVGTLVAQQLLAAGRRVRMVRRRVAPTPVAGVELVVADLRDPAQATAALRDARVAYHCVNPAYTEWATALPAQNAGILAGAAQSGARLIILDNLYVYGDTTRMGEDSPMAPVSRKGELRRQAAEAWMAAHARGEASVTLARAGDFFGPGAERAYLGDAFFQRIVAGKAAQALGDPDQPHTYAYTPDVAAGLIALGRRDDTAGQTWMLPVQPAMTTRDLMLRLGRAAGRDVRIQRLPQWLLRTVGLFSAELREVAEMTYQWRQPYIVDDARIRALGVIATPLDQAIAATGAWARQHYAPNGVVTEAATRAA